MCSRSDREKRRRLHWSDSVNRAETFWSEGADLSPGKDSHRSDWAAAVFNPQGDSRAEEDHSRAEQMFIHWRPHPLPPGNPLPIEINLFQWIITEADTHVSLHPLMLSFCVIPELPVSACSSCSVTSPLLQTTQWFAHRCFDGCCVRFQRTFGRSLPGRVQQHLWKR